MHLVFKTNTLKTGTMMDMHFDFLWAECFIHFISDPLALAKQPPLLTSVLSSLLSLNVREKNTKMTGFLFCFALLAYGLGYRPLWRERHTKNIFLTSVWIGEQRMQMFPLFPSVLDSSSWGGAVHVQGSGQPSPLNLSANPLTDSPTYAPR